MRRCDHGSLRRRRTLQLNLIFLRIVGPRCCVMGQHQLRLFDLNGEATGQDKANQRDHLANLADSIIR
jgi:hypothetical protein